MSDKDGENNGGTRGDGVESKGAEKVTDDEEDAEYGKDDGDDDADDGKEDGDETEEDEIAAKCRKDSFDADLTSRNWTP